MPNRLALSLSPYLQQHRDNPVDWYPWGSEALQRAAHLDRPVLLSIGYAACHWCHVMAHESFEDPDIAAVLNRHFVAIKVDRQEHPGVDATYQSICQMATGQGGWPLTVFATPTLHPFYVGTYFPPTTSLGRPGFLEVLHAIAEAWQDDRDTLLAVAQQWIGAIRQTVGTAVHSAERGTELPTVANMSKTLLRDIDPVHGGFLGAPKFPHTESLELMLRAGGRALDRACFTLQAMAAGGICDQIGGGFHRYSTDGAWQIPHFEKMLVDNALLPPVYLAAFQATGQPEFAEVARHTLQFLLRELQGPDGAFCASLDADSPGPDGAPQEGAFYTWTPQEVRLAVHDPQGAERACLQFGITDQGNIGSRTVPHRTALSVEHDTVVEDMRRRLLAARESRGRPGRDDNVFCGWNGLVLSALAQAGRILNDADYLQTARRLESWIHQHMVRDGDGLLRRYRHGHAGIEGTLEDYAYWTAGLIDLYEATLDPRVLSSALRWARQCIQRFWDREQAAFRLVEDSPDLPTRLFDDGDSGTPAAQSVAVSALLRLLPFTSDPAFTAIPSAVFQRTAPLLVAQARNMASLGCALDRLQPVEIILGGPVPAKWVDQLRKRYLPRMILSHVPESDRENPERFPAWEGRQTDQTTAWVCRDQSCQPPAHTWTEVEAALRGAGPEPDSVAPTV